MDFITNWHEKTFKVWWMRSLTVLWGHIQFLYGGVLALIPLIGTVPNLPAYLLTVAGVIKIFDAFVSYTLRVRTQRKIENAELGIK